ncbi:MAG: BamA/TamA family outer membrane protein [Rikenellaceae bacterium]
MMRSLIRYTLYLGILIAALACGAVRNTPQDSYFLKRVKVVADNTTPKEERIPAWVLESYIRQSPNKRLLGTNFYVWAYNLANPEKDNSWNRFKRKVGQAPIYYNNNLTEKGAENLKIYMNSQGYYSSESSSEVDTTRRKKRAYVTYRVEQKLPYIITSHDYLFQDTLVEPIILRDTATSLIRVGSPFNATTLDRERERIANNLRQRGYFNFTTNSVAFLADTLAENRSVVLTTIIKPYLAGYNEQGEAIIENHTRYRVNNVNIAPNFDPTIVMTDTAYLSKIDTTNYHGLNVVYEGERANVRSNVLRQAVPIYPNSYYNSSLVEETYKNLISIGYFKSAKVMFTESAAEDPIIDSTFRTSRRGVDTTLITSSPVNHLTCNILCTPALTQSIKLEAEGSTTSSFYGLSATVGYQNRNIFRGAEAFNIALTTGYEYMKSQNVEKRKATELGVSTGLSFPRFILPELISKFPQVVQPRTNLDLSVNYQDRPYYTRTLMGASWDYAWRTNGNSSYTVRPIDINLIRMEDLDQDFYESLNNDYLEMSFETQLLAGLSFSYVYNNQLSKVGSNATMFRYNFESSGNLIGLFSKWLATPSDKGTYNILGIPYAQYLRTDINVSRKIMLGEVTAIAARWYSGVGFAYGNSLSLPFDRLFYTGGSNSMRGWSPRTLGPGSTLLEEYADPTADSSDDYPNKVGDIRLEANLELRFPLWGNIHGATFFDLGNVWYMNKNSYDDPDGIFHFDSFYKQLGFNTGFGLRLDITFAVLRLDWGVQLHNPNLPEGERWITKFGWDHTSLNFGVGYPF